MKELRSYLTFLYHSGKLSSDEYAYLLYLIEAMEDYETENL